MKPIKQLLNDADPLQNDPAISPSKRDALRHTVINEARAANAGAANSRFRFVRLASISVLVIVGLLLGWGVWPRIGSVTHAAVRFEVRLAEDMPAPGLREAKVQGNDRTIYLHPEVVVSNSDISRAEVTPGRTDSEFFVGVHFTTEGAQKMKAATQNHIGKPVAILIEDEVVMAPTLRSPIGDSAQISGNFTREQAERIAMGIY